MYAHFHVSAVYPVTCHEGTDGMYRDISNLFLTLGLDGGGWSTPCPGLFTPGKETWGDWVGPRPSLGQYRKEKISSLNCPAFSKLLY